ncbi:MAG: flagellar motor switch protein FliG, partial [Proteobacteria bacterium]
QGKRAGQTDQEVRRGAGHKIPDLKFRVGGLHGAGGRSMQEVLRAVPTDRLLVAMKGADDTLREKIYRNMSRRAAEMLKDDLEARGPVRLSEVEAAQKEILAMVRRMAEMGTIQLNSKGDEYI